MCHSLQYKSENRVHLNPLSAIGSQVFRENTLGSAKPFAIALHKNFDLINVLNAILLRYTIPSLVDIEQAGKIKELVVHGLLGVLEVHAAQAPRPKALGAKASVAIDAHLSRSISACRVITHEPAGVVARNVLPDLRLELSDNREIGKKRTAVLGWTGDAAVTDNGCASCVLARRNATKLESVLALSAAEL
jgi:hypothetical protein